MAIVLPDKETVLAAHEKQIERFGGLRGMRDEGLLESALARPENLLVYGGSDVDIFQVAASLGYGLAKNHPFLDGNKRTSLAATYLLLWQNGYRLNATDENLFAVWHDLAAGLEPVRKVPGGGLARDFRRPRGAERSRCRRHRRGSATTGTAKGTAKPTRRTFRTGSYARRTNWLHG